MTTSSPDWVLDQTQTTTSMRVVELCKRGRTTTKTL